MYYGVYMFYNNVHHLMVRYNGVPFNGALFIMVHHFMVRRRGGAEGGLAGGRRAAEARAHPAAPEPGGHRNEARRVRSARRAALGRAARHYVFLGWTLEQLS